ncbi:MAG TPA: hypothetical protein VGH87_24880 [Polyangiaceae bacterium]|jgi:hypothetical protein|nr:hypothetical protein [Polyangiaceae bacterium]
MKMKCVVVACFLVACGGAAPAESTTPASTSGGASAPEMSPMVQNAGPSDSRAAQVNAARGDFDRAESRVSAAMSDCATACRALESMERAAEHLCALESGSECGRARERLEAARERVRSSCGGCR